MSTLTPEQEFTLVRQNLSSLCHSHRHLAGTASLAIKVINDQQAKIDALVAERDALQAKLDALEKQEPVGYLHCHPVGNVCRTMSAIADDYYGMPVYSQPVPASPIEREGCSYLAMQGTVCNKCGEIHK